VGASNEDEDAARRGRDTPEDKTVAGVPYDLRRPTVSRAVSRLYNREDPRLFPPKSFGVGWTINFYWIVHPWAYRPGKGPRSRAE